MCMCYLAGAIDQVIDRGDKDITKTWKARAKEELNNNRISTIDPAGTFNKIGRASCRERV